MQESIDSAPDVNLSVAALRDRAQDDFLASITAVRELRADWICDQPTDDEEDWDDDFVWEIGPDPEPTAPYREDLDDWMPSAADSEWVAIQSEDPRAAFQRFLIDQADYFRYLAGSEHAGWLAAMIDTLLSGARATDARSGEELDDRIAALDGHNGRAGR